MDTKALKQKILDLAIRGKLVPQDPNDEPASVLLEKIRAEKQQMVKDGMLNSKDLKNDTVIFVGEDNLHYEKFSDGTIKCLKDETKFFKIPKSWSFVRIRDIASVKGGKRIPKGKEFSAVPTPHAYIRVTNMKNRTITTSDLKYISDEIYETIRNYTISKTDLYLTIAGTIGLVGEVPDLLDGMNLTENAVKVTPFSINKTFLCFCLLSCFVQNQFQDKTHQVAQPKLAIERILNTIIPLPPLNEQILITNSVKTAFNLVDCVEKQNIALGEIITKTKSKILDLAIRGKLVPQDPNDEPASVLLERIHQEKEGLIKAGKLKRDKRESVIFRGEDNSYYEKFSDGTIKCIQDDIPFVLPTGWCWERLGNVSSIARGGSPRPIDDYLTDSPEGVNWIKIGDTEKDGKYIYKTKEKIKPEGVIKSRFVRSGDFLLTNSMSFGRPYILKTDGCIHDGWLVIGEIEKAFDQDFLYYCLSSKFMFSELSKVAAGSTVQNLKSDTVKNVLFPIPPLKEQKGISKRIIELFSILTDMESELM